MFVPTHSRDKLQRFEDVASKARNISPDGVVRAIQNELGSEGLVGGQIVGLQSERKEVR